MKHGLLLMLLMVPVARGRDSYVFVGNGAGPGGPAVKEFDATLSIQVDGFSGFTPQFSGGVRVAMADMNGDGIADFILGAGSGGGPTVSIFDGATGSLLQSFYAFDPSFSGGVYVAAGDVNGDGVPDIVVGADAGGGSQVSVFDGRSFSLINSFLAYAPQFTGGVRVAVGDFNGNGFGEIITSPGPGGLPDIKVFDGAKGQLINSFLAFNPIFTGGVYVAAGDLSGNNSVEIICGAGAGGAPSVATFDGQTGALNSQFLAFDPAFTGGVRVAVTDGGVGGAQNIVVGAGPGGGPEVRVFSGGQFAALTLKTSPAAVPIDDFLAFDTSDTNGVFVAGTPRRAAPKARISPESGGTFEIQFSGVPGLGYQVFTTTNFFNSNWSLLTNFQMAAGGTYVIQVPEPTNLAARFYKMIPAP